MEIGIWRLLYYVVYDLRRNKLPEKYFLPCIGLNLIGAAPKASSDFNLGNHECFEVLKIEQAVFIRAIGSVKFSEK
jgi:hypothetical protein